MRHESMHGYPWDGCTVPDWRPEHGTGRAMERWPERERSHGTAAGSTSRTARAGLYPSTNRCASQVAGRGPEARVVTRHKPMLDEPLGAAAARDRTSHGTVAGTGMGRATVRRPERRTRRAVRWLDHGRSHGTAAGAVSCIARAGLCTLQRTCAQDGPWKRPVGRAVTRHEPMLDKPRGGGLGVGPDEPRHGGQSRNETRHGAAARARDRVAARTESSAVGFLLYGRKRPTP